MASKILSPNIIFPDTEKYWESEGLQIKMIEPMKKWMLHYNGEMIHQSTKQRFKVTLQVELTKSNIISSTRWETTGLKYLKLKSSVGNTLFLRILGRVQERIAVFWLWFGYGSLDYCTSICERNLVKRIFC